MDIQEIGKIIKERRQKLRVTQQEVADLAEVGINTLVAIERGRGNPKISTILDILNVLGLDINIS